MLKIFVALPCQNQVASEFAYSLAHLCGFTMLTAGADNVLDISINMVNSTYIETGRSSLVTQAKAVGADWIFWLDSDMRFPKDALIRLLNRNKPIVGVNYSTRKVPPVAVTFKSLNPPGDMTPHPRLYTTEDSTGLESAAVIGFGCVLTHISVFDKVPAPYFRCDWQEDRGGHIGEDAWFCERAREAGYEVLVDHDLSHEIGHVGAFTFLNMHACEVREETGNASPIVLPPPAKIEVVPG